MTITAAPPSMHVRIVGKGRYDPRIVGDRAATEGNVEVLPDEHPLAR